MQKILKDGKHFIFLATVDEEGKPHLRPITALVESGKIYFSTKDSSRKAKEIALNPCCEILIPNIENDKLSYLRISGEALRILEESLKNKIIENSGYNIQQYVPLKEADEILLYELLPTAAELFNSETKTTRELHI